MESIATKLTTPESRKAGHQLPQANTFVDDALTVELIDTSGIDDARDIEVDKINMQNILNRIAACIQRTERYPHSIEYELV